MPTKRRYTRKQIKGEVDRFDWSPLDSLSDEQIEEAAKSDPSAILLKESELAEADLVIPAKARRKLRHAAK